MADLPKVANRRQLTETETETLRRIFLIGQENEPPFSIIEDWGKPPPCDFQLSTPAYFERLFTMSVDSTCLPSICDIEDRETGTVPIYECNATREVVLPVDQWAPEGLALSLRILPRMLTAHLSTRLQHELRLMMEVKTTSEEQVNRVASLLDRYSKFSLDIGRNSQFLDSG